MLAIPVVCVYFFLFSVYEARGSLVMALCWFLVTYVSSGWLERVVVSVSCSYLLVPCLFRELLSYLVCRIVLQESV
jgi:hypothetical protein